MADDELAGPAAAEAIPVTSTAAPTSEPTVAPIAAPPLQPASRMPRWVVPATAVFWTGALLALAVRFFWSKLSGIVVLLAVSLFLSLAIEPGVNRLARRGWRRGSATLLIVFGVLLVVFVFIGAVATLIGSQIADLLTNTETYIRKTVSFLNDTFGLDINAQQAIDTFNDPDGAVQRFISDQRDDAVQLSVTALGWMLQLFSVMLFTFYLVADGPRLRRAICSRFTPETQERVLNTWELAATKTGGYLYSRGLLALLSAFFHWIVFQSIGTAAPIALAIWVGLISQFLPVVGTYLAGILPVVITFLDSPFKALIVLIAIVVYQQIENYVLSPRITARTMELHPALAFGSALAGAAVLGAVGAVLALPVAAMAQALLSELGSRHEVIDSDLTHVPVKTTRTWRPHRRIVDPDAPTAHVDVVASPPAPARRGRDMNVDDVAPIAQTVRNGMVESVHHGIVLAVRADGSVALAVGRGDAAVYPRSALKPLQAEAMLAAGLALDPRRLAVACASHSGEPQHIAVVREILAGAGLDESALRNTPDLPLSAEAMADVLRAGGGRTPILQNCSGKHAAMLATCVVNGWPRDGYLDAAHPVQQAIARTIGDLAGGVVHTGVDGCGAPTAMVGLRGIGAAFRYLATAGCASYRSMVAHPDLVAGTERDDTVVMRAIPGLLVKGGAEGVVVAAHPDGRFVAIKVADGAERARTAVLRVALAALDFDVEHLPPAPILGHGRPVGLVESLVG